MKIRTPCVLALLLVTGIGPSQSATSDIEWVRHYDTGMQQAVRGLKPVVIDFWASWCGPCLKMDRETYPDSRVKEFSNHFVFLQIDVDEDKYTESRYHVQSLPTTVFLDPFGNEIMRQEGFIHAKEMSKILASIPKDYSELSEFREELSPESTSIDALIVAGMAYRRNGLGKLSTDLLERAVKQARKSGTHEQIESAYREQAMSYLAMEKEKKAEKVFRERIEDCENCPMTPYFLLGLGKTYFQMGKKDKARQVYEDLLRRYPNTEFSQLAQQALGVLQQ